jgi:hypothetical protein
LIVSWFRALLEGGEKSENGEAASGQATPGKPRKRRELAEIMSDGFKQSTE